MKYIATTLQNMITIDKLILVHYFEYSSKVEFRGERHNFWEMVYVDNGCVEVYADGVRHIVHSGEMIFHKPNEFHTIAAHDSTNPNLIIISFVADGNCIDFYNNLRVKVSTHQKVLLHKVLHETRLAFKNPIHSPGENAGMIRRENAPLGSEQLIKSYLEQFLIDVYREGQSGTEEFERGADLSFMLPQSENQYVAETLIFLNNNITSKLHIAQVCQEIGIGRSRLQQLFNDEFGCGVIDYFNKLKSVAAKNLLRSTTLNINTIADKLGFTSATYFSRHFKNTFGITPTQYRKAVYDATQNAKGLMGLNDTVEWS